MQKIYIVEDDDGIRAMLVYALSSAGFAADGFSQGDEVFRALSEEVPSLILLDIMLPGQDGITILKRLRDPGLARQIPVVMLTAKGGELDRIIGLDLGADDYIAKPFSVLEVISRVKAVLRRSESEAVPKEKRIGDLTLNSQKRSVFCGETEVTLTFKEFELLAYLMINEGIVLSRDKLLSEVWGFDYSGGSRTVDMHIKSLRQKLGPCGELILTVRNVGYKIGGAR